MTRACGSQLVARARSRTLSDAERLALDAHLTSCAGCRIDGRIIGDFLDTTSVDVRDGERIAHLSAVARGWVLRQERAGDRARRPAWLRSRLRVAAASVLLLAGTASAAAWWSREPAAPAAHPGPGGAKLPAGIARPAAGTRAGTIGEFREVVPLAPIAAPVEEPALAPATGPSRPASVAPAASLSGKRKGDQGGAPSGAARAVAIAGAPAAALLRQAGEARRSGDEPRALGLYRRLEREFAGTSEATVAAVPLATLLYDRGLPRDALVELDAYLRSAPRGALVPEALFGRARALGALGDARGEQRAWRRLLEQFPDSAYAPLARRRLEASR